MQRLSRALLVGGVVATVVGLSKLHAAIVAVPSYDYSGSPRLAWSLAFVAVLAVAAYGAGLPDLPRTLRSASVSSVAAAGAAGVALSVIQLVTGDALLPRFVVFGSALVLVPWYVLCATLASRGRGAATDRDRVVVVAGPGEVALLDEELDGVPDRPASIVANLTVAEAADVGVHHRPLVEAAVAGRATVVVIDQAAQTDEVVVAQAAALHGAGIRVRTLSLFYEEWLGKLPVNELERVSLLFDIGEVHRARYGRLKRLADVVVAAAALPVLAAAVPVIVVGNLAANRGPLLYRQERVGKHGRGFTILKFRTMTSHAGAVPDTCWTAERDPRVTPFGRFLRRTHLDELPQVLNIVRGDLSVVGPRPVLPRYVEELTEKLAFYELRHLVRPGLTGWAQVKYGYAGDESDALEKLQYEFFYLRRQSLSLDARIVGRTLRSVLGRQGR